MASLVVQYCSDLHLEFRENREFLETHPLEPRGEILLPGGDILPFGLREKYAYFFDYVADNFEQVYWLPGFGVGLFDLIEAWAPDHGKVLTI